MLKALGAVGMAKLILQIIILCLTLYEVVKAGKFLRVAKKNKGALISMYLLSIYIVVLWAFLTIYDKTVDRYTTLIAAYAILYSIPREIKPREIK